MRQLRDDAGLRDFLRFSDDGPGDGDEPSIRARWKSTDRWKVRLDDPADPYLKPRFSRHLGCRGLDLKAADRSEGTVPATRSFQRNRRKPSRSSALCRNWLRGFPPRRQAHCSQPSPNRNRRNRMDRRRRFGEEEREAQTSNSRCRRQRGAGNPPKP